MRLFRMLAAAVAAIVLVQAALAGQFLFGTEGARSVHRVIGEGLFLLAGAAAFQGWRIRDDRQPLWWLSLALLALVVAQTGLGFAGREASGAAAMHVPVGVLTFGVALAAALLAAPAPARDQDR